MSNNINVVYHFTLAPNVTKADFLTANQPIADLMKAQPGFHYRSVAQCADGSWLDSIFWENAECASKAMQAFEQSPDAAAFMASLDINSVKRLEGHIAQSSMD